MSLIFLCAFDQPLVFFGAWPNSTFEIDWTSEVKVVSIYRFKKSTLSPNNTRNAYLLWVMFSPISISNLFKCEGGKHQSDSSPKRLLRHKLTRTNAPPESKHNRGGIANLSVPLSVLFKISIWIESQRFRVHLLVVKDHTAPEVYQQPSMSIAYILNVANDYWTFRDKIPLINIIFHQAMGLPYVQIGNDANEWDRSEVDKPSGTAGCHLRDSLTTAWI